MIELIIKGSKYTKTCRIYKSDGEYVGAFLNVDFAKKVVEIFNSANVEYQPTIEERFKLGIRVENLCDISVLNGIWITKEYTTYNNFIICYRENSDPEDCRLLFVNNLTILD